LNAFTLLFLLALAAGTALKLWLAARQLHAVARHRGEVPPAFRDRVGLEAHRRAADYTTVRTRLGMVETGVAALLLLAWTLGGGLAALDAAWRALDLPALVEGTALVLSVFLVMGALELPFDAYRTFVIEERFGFNKTTPRLFAVDTVKQTALLLVLGAPIVALVLWLMAHAGAWWWLYAWGVWMAFSLGLTWAYPTFIAPIFNDFAPLEDDALRSRIDALLGRNGFAAEGVFVMDGSRRSGHGNAYFTGFGNRKRIVFFDTLLENLAAEEIEAVLAHELGHFKRRHVMKRVALMAATSLVGLAVLGWLIGEPWFYAGLGVSQPSLAVALVLFLLVVPVFAVFVQPLLTRLSRRHEFEADDFAAAETNAANLVRALVKLYRENASTLTPDPLYSAFHDSHPPAPVRIAHLEGRAT